MPVPATPFAALRWADLENWVGQRVFARGKTYRHRVQNLAVTENWQLVADVPGTRKYITNVWLVDGKPSCRCSCPYGGPCKHAVAVVLAYLDGVKENAPPPLIQEDELQARLAVLDLPSALASDRKADLKRGRAALEAMSKPELIDWVMGLAASDPMLLEALPLTSPADDEALAEEVSRLRRKIHQVKAEEGWIDPWEDEDPIPRYASIEKGLRALLDGGHIEAVLALGDEVFELGTYQAGIWDEEGETASKVSDCLAVVVEAMAKSQRPASERLIWYWDKLLQDEYNLLMEVRSPMGRRKVARQDWRTVADEFIGRLVSSRKPHKNKQDFSDRYRRNQLLEFAVEALRHAGENERAVELMIAELPHCWNYVDLVKQLLADKHYEQAEQWAREGFDTTMEEAPGTAWQMVELLLQIAKRRRNKGLATALRVDTFVWQGSTVEDYRLVRREAATKSLWQQVSSVLLHFLETGQLPSSTADWPLPATGLKFPKPRIRRDFPNRRALLEIALHEKRPKDALRWFREMSFNQFQGDTVAKAVQKVDPDASLDIWRTIVESLIARVDVKAYSQAMPHLRKMKKLLHDLGRGDEHDRYIATLRRQHKAKRRLMADLDALENRSRRIVDG